MKKNAPTVIASLAAAALIGYAVFGRSAGAPAEQGALTVIPAGAQVVDITAKGGYAPATQTAKAGVPTVLRVSTDGNFDCSSSLRIPALGVSERLPANGQTLIALGTPSAGTLRGTCSMGMYSFEINFQA